MALAVCFIRSTPFIRYLGMNNANETRADQRHISRFCLCVSRITTTSRGYCLLLFFIPIILMKYVHI